MFIIAVCFLFLIKNALVWTGENKTQTLYYDFVLVETKKDTFRHTFYLYIYGLKLILPTLSPYMVLRMA